MYSQTIILFRQHCGPIVTIRLPDGAGPKPRGHHRSRNAAGVSEPRGLAERPAKPADAWLASATLPRGGMNSPFAVQKAHSELSPVPLWANAGDRECCAPAYLEGSIMPQPQRLSSVLPFAAIGRPACPKCKAPMMLISIEPARAGVDLHTFECAICNRVFKTLAPYDDPMKSKGLGRWLQGDLHPPK